MVMVKGDFPRADVPKSLARVALREKIASADLLPEFPITTRELPFDARFPGKATAVVGMRRVGKTTFMHQLRRERTRRGLPPENLPWVSFEDERLDGFQAAELGFLEYEYDRLHPNARERGPVVWSLDEIHLVPGWERFVRRLLDTPGTEVVISGSSAALLSREMATALRGRGWEVPIHPFSFREALAHRRAAVPDPAAPASRSSTARIERAFFDWLTRGGFPEAQQDIGRLSRSRLLRGYVDTVVLRDVIERHGIRNPRALIFLVRQLLTSPAALFSVERFRGAVRARGVRTARTTIRAMLSHLEDAFLFGFVSIASASERKRAMNPRKVYPADSGLIPVFERSGRPNRGRLLETAVFVELQRRCLDVSYVHTPSRREVDFLAVGADGAMELIQVAADLDRPITAEREFAALREAGKLHPQARKRLLTLTADPLPFEPPPDVRVEAAWEWMLAAPA